jgi:hypothetical protein
MKGQWQLMTGGRAFLVDADPELSKNGLGKIWISEYLGFIYRI